MQWARGLPMLTMALLLVASGCESNNKGKIEGTTWSCNACTVKGNPIPAGAVQIDFSRDGKMTMRAYGQVINSGTYSLGFQETVTIRFNQAVNGKNLAREKITINGSAMTMVDPDGTTMTFNRVGGPPPPPASPIAPAPPSPPGSPAAGQVAVVPAGPPPPPPPPMTTLSVGSLEKAILFQPMFLWSGREPSQQGTGFFVKAPNGKLVGVSSAHFLDRDGPALLEARWLGIRTKAPAASFTKSWGPPGSAGNADSGGDLRSDYLLMPAPEGVSDEFALELDPRPRPDPSERIWLPNKDETALLGHRLVTGKVLEADDKFIQVMLDQSVELQSQSGSPVVSQTTNKVIGTLSRGGIRDGKTVLLLAPASAILQALAKDQEFPLLRDVIGKQAAAAADSKPVASAPSSPDFRTWSDASGKFRIEAQLVTHAAGKVTLKKRDGQMVQVALEKLSEDDRAYVAATMPSP